jgi:glutamate-1-semialdehyde 2,1-aminomutase
MTQAIVIAVAALAALVARALWVRARLSRAKHPSIGGHARISRRLVRFIPYYTYDEDRFFRSDDPPVTVSRLRREGFMQLASRLRDRAPLTVGATSAAEPLISDLQFTQTYRVPFQYREVVQRHLPIGAFAQESDGVRLVDLDGNVSFDLAGSYGMNVFGYDFYKACIAEGSARVSALGPVLGPYHPVVDENVRRLREISGLDEVSFHMSGTEAVMQAVRLARYHTRRTHLVQFTGAYHGWWDGVQPGVGNPRPVSDVYVLKELDEDTLHVLRTRRDIACVLVNPVQLLHPNAGAPGDGSLVTSASREPVGREAYAGWLQQLREVCTERGIVLIFDEVFLGFRLALGGVQEYFGVRADMVTYGKTVGGGLPVGVLCGRRDLMKRFCDERPADVCFARGTFNAHPYVMGAMNEFLRRIDTPAMRHSYAEAQTVWDKRAADLNARLTQRQLPVRVANLCSVWTIRYTTPSRYNWMFQYYLRDQGLSLSWVGSGRLIFSHVYADADFETVAEMFIAAASAMHADGWWWHRPGLTNGAIRRQLLIEMALTLARGRRSDRTTRRAAGAPARRDTASRHETGP